MRRSRSESSGRGRIHILVQPAFASEHSLQLVLRSPRLAAQLNSVCYCVKPLIRHETSAWSGREPSAFDFLRL